MKLTSTFLKERYEKDEQYFQVYDHYTPNYNSPIVTGKFYARHDAQDCSLANPEIVEAIRMTKDKGPKERNDWPVTESQCYGWWSRPLVDQDRNDRRFYKPSVMNDAFKHEIKLRMDNTMKLAKFTGEPFRF